MIIQVELCLEKGYLLLLFCVDFNLSWKLQNNFLTTKVAEGLDAMQHSRVLFFLYYALIHPYGYIDEFLQIF